MKKKEYQAPKLIVIVRCKPEENVLTVCKQSRTACGNAGAPSFILAAS
ncbi:MAG: hypothetical protein KKE44_21305 [Proteobacteria bacterium]|nr:hypothetical protein [Pseudomonadota bacterium]MBU1585271.1 hypothetical protein [Pseudomonadota bacterium]MBU2455513.1 hypothetical protein [Pseudomonadota bacterium]MBU2626985.1 hypothetical protein [Pseudomonadota bacterium]